jgi:hypothetical protein
MYMLIKVALVVLLLTSLLTAGMDDQQTNAANAAATETESVSEEAEVKTVSAIEPVSGWADEFTPITFVTFR